jgi:methylaspartate mutase sigma subunit
VPGTSRPTLLTTLPSDAHTWNLVFLQLFLEERGHHVVNLGATVPIALVEREACRLRPDLIVVSTVNGHGVPDGMRLVEALRRHPDLAATRIVIGGKLGVDGPQGPAVCDELLHVGYDGVYQDDAGPEDLLRDLAVLPRAAQPVR